MPNQLRKFSPGKLDWQVEVFRATAFPIDGQRIDTPWWDKLVPEPPETIVSHPKEGIKEEKGPFENGKLILRTQPNRIDWQYTIDIEKPEGVPNLGSFYNMEYGFFNIVRNWLTICDEIKRLAFGTILLYPVANKEEGYNLISDYLPYVHLDPINSSDFLYQINRPYTSKVTPPIIINRLSKWSIARYKLFKMELSGGEKMQPTFFQDSYACRLEIDINNSPKDVDQLPKEKLVPIFDELYSLANEISRNGDIK
jgi:hypothetical protein